MKTIFFRLMQSNVGSNRNNRALLFFRTIVCLELIIVHGLKKLGVGVEIPEVVPNPLGLPETLNFIFATCANILFPTFIIFGIFTRLSTLPVLAVTLTGYFIVHGGDSLIERDIPFMYSLCFLLILLLGPGKYSLDTMLSKKS